MSGLSVAVIRINIFFSPNVKIMELVVSFEMAQKLKKAGFPQPEFTYGQIWYNKEGTALNIDLLFGKMIFKPWDSRIPGWAIENAPPIGEIFFAMTAENLLKTLPESYRNLNNKPVVEGTVFSTNQKIEFAEPNAYGQIWLDENTNASKV